MADDPEARTETAAPSRGGRLAMGVGYALGGAALLLLALGVIPAEDRMFPAGRFIVGLVAVCIGLAGVVVFTRAAGATAVAQRLAPVLALLFMTTVSGFFTWAWLTGHPGSTSVQGFPFFLLPTAVSRAIDKTLLAIAVLILDALTVWLWLYVLRALVRRLA